MKKLVVLFITSLPLVTFGQWSFQKVDNGFDAPYKIAYTSKNNDALLKLEPVEVEVPLPKKYIQEGGMLVFETNYEHSIFGGTTLDFSTGNLKNMTKVFSGELVVIAGQTTLEVNGTAKKYFLLYDGLNSIYTDEEEIKFLKTTELPVFDAKSTVAIDSLIKVSKVLREKNNSIPQLYEKKNQISFYLSGGYHCDEEIPVDISFLVDGQYKKYALTGTNSSNSSTVFLIDDLNSSPMKTDFLKATSVKLRFNESHCQSDYYEFKMTGSTAAFNFVNKP
jgi:hypothetical protein